ncbi:unnamed protein product [Oikopleura dioica]|uniref:Glutathione peroxidase n=1 Tax=Oikopleura dioica TaxID=34765 RepID=E4YBH7_OIKDI|nr:unnamed protein product [Oikopleura dioica]
MGDQGLSIVAFPCNQFLWQEPGTDEEIYNRIHDKYGITFQMMHKIKVNGRSAIDIYKWLKSTPVGGDRSIKWNFTNFLLDRCGHVRFRHEPSERPNEWKEDVLKLLREDSC